MSESAPLEEKVVEAEVATAKILKTNVKAKFIITRQQNEPLRISLNRNILSDLCCVTQTMHIVTELIKDNNPKDKKRALTKQELIDLRIAIRIINQLERKYEPHVRSYLNKISEDNVEEFAATDEDELEQQP